MLAGELAAGPELGEDRDHHAAQLIAVGFTFGDGFLQSVQRLLVIAGVPRFEGGGEIGRGAVRRKPGAGEQPGGGEVGLEGLQQRDGLVEVAAGDQDAAERGRGLRLPGIELQGPAEIGLVV